MNRKLKWKMNHRWKKIRRSKDWGEMLIVIELEKLVSRVSMAIINSIIFKGVILVMVILLKQNKYSRRRIKIHY